MVWDDVVVSEQSRIWTQIWLASQIFFLEQNFVWLHLVPAQVTQNCGQGN